MNETPQQAFLRGNRSRRLFKELSTLIRNSYGIPVKRRTIYDIIKAIDAEHISPAHQGRQLRATQYTVPGPNHLWHFDCYGVLKRFGLAILGCIDGFSRKVIWLDVVSTDNDADIAAYYYLKALKKFKFIPAIIRSDKGIENAVIESLQTTLRSGHQDEFSGDKSFCKDNRIYKQRIKSFWPQLRRLGLDFWIQTLLAIEESDAFDDSDNLQVSSIRYCFGPLIRSDLELIKNEWNLHTIKKQKDSGLPSGKPNVLFNLPQRFGKVDCKKDIDDNSIDTCMAKYTKEPTLYPEIFDKLVELLLPNVPRPTNRNEAVEFYVNLIHAISQYD